MKLVLFVILFALSAFAAEVAGGSNAAEVADGFLVRTGALSSLLVSVQSGSFNADSVMAAEASGEKSSKSSDEGSDEEDCEGEDCDDEDCEGEDCDDDSEDSDGEDVADSSEDSAADSATADSIVKPKSKNIPLPRQTAYTGKGLSVGLGGGVYNPTEDCDCMGIWQGQLEYFYSEMLSLSIDVRFFGGDLDSDVMVMYQRYRLNLRIHKAWENLALFVEPVLGFENTSISEFRREIRHHGKRQETVTEKDNVLPSWVVAAIGGDTTKVDTTEVDTLDEPCERMMSLDGFSIGVGAGVGLNLSRLWGVTGSVLFEYNFSNAMQLSLIPGVAFNLREVWGWAKKNLLATWISVEFGAQRYFNKGVGEWSNYALLGFQLGI